MQRQCESCRESRLTQRPAFGVIIFATRVSELNPDQVRNLDPTRVRNISFHDFTDSLKRIRRSVSPSSLVAYQKWNEDYGDVSA